MKVLLIFLSAAAAGVCVADDWHHWRGNRRNDVVNESSGWNGTAWPLTDAWKTNVGLGSTSPVVVSDRLYVVGWEANTDIVRCLNTANGNEIWRQTYPAPRYARYAKGDKGLYAAVTSTPEYDPTTGLLYTLGVDGDLNCWETKSQGHRKWSLNLYDRYKVKQRPDVGRNTHRDYGYTSAPIVVGDMLVVEVGDDSGNLIAFDKRTGKQAWASQCKDEAGHNGGPVPIVVDEIECLAVLTHRNLVVVRTDAEHAGRTLAKHKWTTDFGNNVASPAVHGDSVIITSAYNQYAMARLKITSQGAREVWKIESPSKVCTPVIHAGNVYWAWRGVHCVDFETGKSKWDGGKVADAGSCVITSDDRLIVLADRGNLSLVESAKRSPDKYVELASRKGLLKTDAWPHVVLANGRIYCKDRNGLLVCLLTKPKK